MTHDLARLRPTAAPCALAAHTLSAMPRAAAFGRNQPRFSPLALAAASAMALASVTAHAQGEAGAAAAPASAPPAPAASAALVELKETTLALIEALVEQGLLSRARADDLLRKARQAGQQAAATQAPVVQAAGTTGAASPATASEAPGWGQPRNVIRVPYLPESTKAQIKEDIRNDVLATAREEGWADARRLPGWIRSLTLEGDIRVRAQDDVFDSNNLAPEIYRSQTDSPAWSPDLTNTQNDRKRMTLRARLGVTAKASESVSAGVRLGTTSGRPTSSSQTLGNNFSATSVSMDRAWMRWEPSYGLRLEGGRMAVPFDHTDLLFPDDLALDGLSGKAELDLASGMYGFAVAGAFPLQEFEATGRDKTLYGAQLGVDWALDSRWQLRGALGYYNFQNMEGVRETALPPTGPLAGTTGYQSSQYSAAARLKGNTLINLNAPGSTAAPVWGLASKFRAVDATFSLIAKHFNPYELGLTVDVVKNTGFDLADITRRAGTPAVGDLVDMSRGSQVKLSFGSPRLQEAGEWNTFLAWRKFERDAWVDAFTDTTWNLGGTNYRGFSLGGQYAFDRRATIGARLTSTRNLDDHVRYTTGSVVSGNLSSAPLKIDVFQVDANLRF